MGIPLEKGSGVMYRFLLSRAITGPNFNFIPCMEVMILGRCAFPLKTTYVQRDQRAKGKEMAQFFNFLFGHYN